MPKWPVHETRQALRPPPQVRWLLWAFALHAVVVAAFNVLPEGAIVFSKPGGSSSNDYFGYSVTLTTIQGKPWLMVAAPRANSMFETNYIRTGVIYRCPPTGGNCTELNFRQGTSDSGVEDPLHLNNGSLGGSMDALLKNDGMVVCNPLFKQRNDEALDMPGMCFWINDLRLHDTSLRRRRLIDPPGTYEIDGNCRKIDEHGTPELGFSVHQLKDQKLKLLVGGPGLFAGQGTVLLYSPENSINKGEYGVISHSNNYSYFGYSVTSGKFRRSGDLFVGSAPRAHNLTGQVFVFHYKTQSKTIKASSIIIDKHVNGEQIGEYFGASLAVADLNNDGIDELLVGAPLHSKDGGDEGKVYVFISSEKDYQNENNLLEITEEIMSKLKVPNGRFGTSIASPGDLDKDGYSDIIIGAPYENSEKGAIYIYYGSQESPYLKYEKRIEASEIDHRLIGFGFSFSRGGDIDNNDYNDLAVGSYLSDNAVLLRTSPVLRFHSSVTIKEDKIPMNANSVELSVCIGASNFTPDTSVEVVLNIDTFFNRGYINEMKRIRYKLDYDNKNFDNFCQNFTMALKNNTKIFKPLEIEVNYKIIQSIIKDGLFCKTCPVLDIKSSKAYHYLPYQTGCAGQVCKTDLQLKGKFNGVRSPFVVGSNNSTSIEMVIEVTNVLEASYETNVTIKFPSKIKLRQLHQSCYKLKSNLSDITDLLCEVPYMLNETSEPFVFNVHFDMDSIPWSVNELKVNISVSGSGEEQNILNNNLILLLDLQHVANVSIRGRSNAENIPFANRYNSSEDYVYNNVSFEHSYTILNNGPSPVHGLDLKFMIPHKYKAGGTDITYLFVKLNTPRFKPFTNMSNEIKNSEDKMYQKFRDHQYLILDCNLPEIKCLEIRYNISNVIYAKQGVTISFNLSSPLKELGPHLSKNGIYIRTTGAILNKFILNQEFSGQTYFVADAEIKLSGKLGTQEKVQTWIIVVAVICGIIILVIICIVLWRWGFFKRNKPPINEESNPTNYTSEDKVDSELLCDANP